MRKSFVYIGIVGSIQNLTDEQFSDAIETVEKDLKENFKGDVPVLIHGYMDIPSIEAKKWSTEKRKLIDDKFKYQIPFFVDGAPDREYLDDLTASIVVQKVYVLTETNENVEKEIEYFNAEYTEYLC